MLIWLAKWLGLTGGDPSAPLQLVTVRAGAAALTAFVLMLLIMPAVIRWLKLKKFGEQGGKGQGADLVDAYREGKKGPPTMGGLGLVLCIGLAAVMWCDNNEPRVWLLLGGMLVTIIAEGTHR
jgi:phospho-N-acetylmuramoyl-pentapeptide-transferase